MESCFDHNGTTINENTMAGAVQPKYTHKTSSALTHTSSSIGVEPKKTNLEEARRADGTTGGKPR